MPTPAQRAAHILLDAVSSHNDDSGDNTNELMHNLALGSMENIPSADDAAPNAYAVIAPGVDLIRAAVDIAVGAGLDRDEVIIRLREHIDSKTVQSD